MQLKKNTTKFVNKDKAGLGGKFIALFAYFREEKRLKYNKCSFQEIRKRNPK